MAHCMRCGQVEVDGWEHESEGMCIRYLRDRIAALESERIQRAARTAQIEGQLAALTLRVEALEEREVAGMDESDGGCERGEIGTYRQYLQKPDGDKPV